MSRFPVRDITSRTGGPSVQAAGDGLHQGATYTATLHTARSGSACKVVIPALSLMLSYTAHCSATFAGSPGDRVLVIVDDNKDLWVIATTA